MTETDDLHLTLDQNLALKMAAERLHREFADTFTTETIERTSSRRGPPCPTFFRCGPSASLGSG